MEELLDWAQKGRLGADDLVWKQGMTEWRPARTVAELSGVANWPATAVQRVAATPMRRQRARAQSNGMAIAGMTLGISSLVVLFCLWPVSIPCAATGLILSIIGLNKTKRGSKGKGMALAGLILSIFTLCLIIVLILVGVAMFAGMMREMRGA
jgi:hypothetical protein